MFNSFWCPKGEFYPFADHYSPTDLCSIKAEKAPPFFKHLLPKFTKRKNNLISIKKHLINICKLQHCAGLFHSPPHPTVLTMSKAPAYDRRMYKWFLLNYVFQNISFLFYITVCCKAIRKLPSESFRIYFYERMEYCTLSLRIFLPLVFWPKEIQYLLWIWQKKCECLNKLVNYPNLLSVWQET